MVFLMDSADAVTLENSLMINEQLKKCICRIKVQKTEGTGFFCFIPNNGKNLPVLIFAEYMLHGELTEIDIELNDNENRLINLNDGRKIYLDKELFIAIVEIIPKKDRIYNFLEIDHNLFLPDSETIFEKGSAYILHNPPQNKAISYGIIKSIKGHEIFHRCNTFSGSGGAPILNLSNGKIIGFHTRGQRNHNINLGTFLKIPINKFLEKNKDYISLNGLTPASYWYSDSIYTVKTEIKINNLIEKSQEQEKDQIILLENKIKELNDLLNDNINITNELKAKLSRFPFKLEEGEKIMSIIITSPNKRVIKSIIYKNTDVFNDIEKKIYQNDDEVLGKGNQLTINENSIDKNESLESNKINDNDIIVINNLKV